MAGELKTGYLVEEQVAGIEHWFRTNAWFYEEKGKALDLAERRLETGIITAVRVLKVRHTEPEVIEEIALDVIE